MLADFFRLNPGFRIFESPKELGDLLLVSKHVANILYRPDEWTPTRPSNRVSDTTFENVSFSKTELIGLEFQNCKFKDCLFIGATIRNTEFHQCTFEGCNPHKIVFQDTYIDPSIFSGMLNEKEHSNIGVHLFQSLLRNSVSTQQRDFAQVAEFYFRRWQRYQHNYEARTGRISRSAWLRSWIPSVVFEYFAGYGLRSRYLAVWTAVLLIVIGVFNYAFWHQLGIAAATEAPQQRSFTDAIYFTVITMTTIGYGDFVPTTAFGRLSVAFEGGIGLVLLGTFAATVIKKLVR